MKSRLSNHQHGHYLLLYFIHRTHNNVWNDKAYSSIVKTYFALIASNDSALFLPNSKYMHFNKKYIWLSLHVCTLPMNILKVEICRNIYLFDCFPTGIGSSLCCILSHCLCNFHNWLSSFLHHWGSSGTVQWGWSSGCISDWGPSGYISGWRSSGYISGWGPSGYMNRWGPSGYLRVWRLSGYVWFCCRFN